MNVRSRRHLPSPPEPARASDRSDRSSHPKNIKKHASSHRARPAHAHQVRPRDAGRREAFGAQTTHASWSRRLTDPSTFSGTSSAWAPTCLRVPRMTSGARRCTAPRRGVPRSRPRRSNFCFSLAPTAPRWTRAVASPPTFSRASRTDPPGVRRTRHTRARTRTRTVGRKAAAEAETATAGTARRAAGMPRRRVSGRGRFFLVAGPGRGGASVGRVPNVRVQSASVYADASARLDRVSVHAPGGEGEKARSPAISLFRNGVSRVSKGVVSARRRVRIRARRVRVLAPSEQVPHATV